MANGFLYSEYNNGTYTNTVSAEDLNNIAIDLGLPEFSEFSSDEPTAVSALNNITRDLTSKGVLKVGSCCRPSKSGDTVTFADGVIVLHTGAKYRVNSLSWSKLVRGSRNYYYVIHDTTNNIIQAWRTTSSVPEDGVLLAEVDANGNLIDRRYWSISKTANGTNVIQKENIRVVFVHNLEPVINEIDISQTGGNLIIYEYELWDRVYNAVVELKEGEEVSFDGPQPGNTSTGLHFKKEGARLYIRGTTSSGYDGYAMNMTFTIV